MTLTYQLHEKCVATGEGFVDDEILAHTTELLQQLSMMSDADVEMMS